MSIKKYKVTTAIIPAAGFGTRMLPITKIISKEILPLANTPLIQYIVYECINAGIKKIIFIVNSLKNFIKYYFSPNKKLENFLKKEKKFNLLKKISNLFFSKIEIKYVIQKPILGLGHAIMSAKSTVGNQPIAVLLPDVIFQKKINNLKYMIKRFEKKNRSQILVKYIKNVNNYGIVNCKNNYIVPGKQTQILNIFEKPNKKQAFSNLGIVGRYVLSNNFWKINLKKHNFLKKNNQEIELSDLIAILIKEEVVEACHIIGKSYDCGNKFEYIKAFVMYSLQDKNLGKNFSFWLKKIVKYI